MRAVLAGAALPLAEQFDLVVVVAAVGGRGGTGRTSCRRCRRRTGCRRRQSTHRLADGELEHLSFSTLPSLSVTRVTGWPRCPPSSSRPLSSLAMRSTSRSPWGRPSGRSTLKPGSVARSAAVASCPPDFGEAALGVGRSRRRRGGQQAHGEQGAGQTSDDTTAVRAEGIHRHNHPWEKLVKGVRGKQATPGSRGEISPSHRFKIRENRVDFNPGGCPPPVADSP